MPVEAWHASISKCGAASCGPPGPIWALIGPKSVTGGQWPRSAAPAGACVGPGDNPITVFFEQHRSRWARTASPSQFFDPAQRDFYRELVREIHPRGWLRFDVVLFNGAPLAFHFGFEYLRRFIWYKPTFDVRFASRSPGEVLIKFLLEDAIERKVEEFDFTIGSEPFKYRFANRIRSINRMIAFSSVGDYWIHRGVRRCKSMLKKLLGRNAVSRTSPAAPAPGHVPTSGEA